MNFRRAALLLCIALVLPALLAAAEAKLPADYPKDVPIYPGAKVEQAGPAVKDMVVLSTADSKDKALAFYKAELPKNGWKIEKAYSGSPDALQGMKGSRMISMGVLVQSAGSKNTTKIQIGLLGQ
jgi:hypothetical protein